MTHLLQQYIYACVHACSVVQFYTVFLTQNHTLHRTVQYSFSILRAVLVSLGLVVQFEQFGKQPNITNLCVMSYQLLAPKELINSAYITNFVLIRITWCNQSHERLIAFNFNGSRVTSQNKQLIHIEYPTRSMEISIYHIFCSCFLDSTPRY